MTTSFLRWLMLFSLAMSIGIATPLFAQSAPVYDADAMPQQFETGPDQDRDLPPPPPPTQEGAYVPNQEPESRAATPLNVDQRMRRIEQQINNMQTNDATARMGSLEDQVQSLRGQLEQLSHQLEAIQNQQKNLVADIDKRVTDKIASSSKLLASNGSDAAQGALTTSKSARKAVQKLADKTAPATPTDTAGSALPDKNASKSSAEQPNVAEEQQIYQTAYNFIKAKKYEDAVNTLQGMLKKYPSGQFASNAHYWLGELYNLMSKNDQALNEFTTVVTQYSDSPRVSDAQLKVGLIYASQTKWADAKTAFKKVINRYPGSASARLAYEQLKQIRTAGH